MLPIGCMSSKGENTTCPECGRDDFASNRSMKSHYGRMHNGSIAGIEKTCDQCGDEYRDVDRSHRDQKHDFCSHECYSKWLSENNYGEDHHQWKDNVIQTCEICNDEFEVQESESDRRFCSHDCYGDWISENNVGKDHPRWAERVSNECEYCSKIFKTVPSESYHKYCSMKCMSNHYSETRKGDYFSWWEGGSIHTDMYGSEWIQARRKAKERDGYQCMNCGMNNEEHNNEFNKDLEVHHIQPVRTFDDYSNAHVLDNLITLCVKCHRTIERS